MKNLDRKSEFDGQWKDAFEDAELAPSEGVWDKIDSALSKEEAGYFKRRAFMFKMLAAASVAFAIGIGLFSANYYIDHNSNTNNLTAEKTNHKDNDAKTLTDNFLQNDTEIGANEDLNIREQPDNTLTAPLTSNRVSIKKENDLVRESDQIAHSRIEKRGNQETALAQSSILLNTAEEESSIPETAFGRNDSDYAKLTSISPSGGITSDEVITKDHIYLIPIMPKGASKLKKEANGGSNTFLAGLDVSTGVFDPNFEQGGGVVASSGYSAFADARVGSYNDQLASFNTSNKEFAMVRSSGKKNTPEVAVSYGVNIGYRLGKRILLQTGIAYRKASSATTTTGYIEELGSDTKIPIVASHQYQLNGLSAVSTMAETDLKNQYEFASIPLKAGYVIIDKKINLALMAGISSEFFLNNKIVDKSDYFETLSTSSGDGSPYKRVHFNGSLGTMVGYEFARNYFLTVEPSYRFAMNSFTKDDFYLNSYPSSFMVSFGLAYNFK